MGFLGAVIGEEEYFRLSGIRYSVKIDRQILKKSFVFNGIKFALSSSMHIEEGYQNAKEKKQFYRELICSPSYVVFLNLENLEQRYEIISYKEGYEKDCDKLIQQIGALKSVISFFVYPVSSLNSLKAAVLGLSPSSINPATTSSV